MKSVIAYTDLSDLVTLWQGSMVAVSRKRLGLRPGAQHAVSYIVPAFSYSLKCKDCCIPPQQ